MCVYGLHALMRSMRTQMQHANNISTPPFLAILTVLHFTFNQCHLSHPSLRFVWLHIPPKSNISLAVREKQPPSVRPKCCWNGIIVLPRRTASVCNMTLTMSFPKTSDLHTFPNFQVSSIKTYPLLMHFSSAKTGNNHVTILTEVNECNPTSI